MRAESVIKTITGLSKLWDGDAITRSRAGEGNIMLWERAFSCYLMIQPGLAQKLMLSNGDMSEQGLLSRFLIHYPESTQGSRFIRSFEVVTDHPALEQYEQTLGVLIRQTSFNPETNELERRTVNLDAQALKVWIEFANECESGLGPDGEYREIAPSANKAPMQAARLATVLHTVEGGGGMIGAPVMLRAVEIMRFYLGEALRMFGHGERDADLEAASKLACWFRDKWIPGAVKDGGDRITTRQVVSAARRMVEGKTKRARALLKVLEDHHWIYQPDPHEQPALWAVERCAQFESASTLSTRQQTTGKPHGYAVCGVDTQRQHAVNISDVDAQGKAAAGNVDTVLTPHVNTKTAQPRGLRGNVDTVDDVDAKGKTARRFFQAFQYGKPGVYPETGKQCPIQEHRINALDDAAVLGGFPSWSAAGKKMPAGVEVVEVEA
jgi:hypothetical protein